MTMEVQPECMVMSVFIAQGQRREERSQDALAGWLGCIAPIGAARGVDQIPFLAGPGRSRAGCSRGA